MSWINQKPPGVTKQTTKDLPDGIWTQCQSCQATLEKTTFVDNLNVCPKCGHHHYWPAKTRLQYWFDDGYGLIGEDIVSEDKLDFEDTKSYDERIQAGIKRSGEQEAVVSAFGNISGLGVVVSVFEFQYIGGSMSQAVGDRILAAIDCAIENGVPFICAQASGGARMQEGVFSLMQMARLSSALTELGEAKLPYISVLLNPTSGGVSASIAMLGDVIIAEPKALIGFAGPRVIKQTVGEDLPEGFQRSEMLLSHGSIDAIVPRNEMKQYLVDTVKILLANR
ncbi:MAG: acetyl-CoA carboxylase, carboxyltransferase subunit beta [Candidatus Comchoanobacterales bacterium]